MVSHFLVFLHYIGHNPAPENSWYTDTYFPYFSPPYFSLAITDLVKLTLINAHNMYILWKDKKTNSINFG